MAGVFSVKNTSAGEASPSWTSCAASSESEPLRSSTSTPVFFSNFGAISSSSCSCWAFYTTSFGPSDSSSEQPDAARVATKVMARARIVRFKSRVFLSICSEPF
jgi:hypothetical protein